MIRSKTLSMFALAALAVAGLAHPSRAGATRAAGDAAGDAASRFHQRVAYTIDVRLDTGRHHLTGTETIRYVNESPDTLRRIALHLYPNAYRNDDTAFMRFFRRRYNLNLLPLPGSRRSWIELDDVRAGGRAVTPRIDDTIAWIPLPTPLAPGDSVAIELSFDEKLRRHLGRMGWRGEHYDFAQWYPKVAVYDERGFHAKPWRTGEFYGEFATFDVSMTVPADYVVAATGVPVDGDPGWGFNPVDETRERGRRASREAAGERTVRFHAERVHDFAWSADPTFVVQDTTVSGVTIHSVYQKRHASTWRDSTLAHGVRALRWLENRVGRYPYPQITIVDALLGGGMEYPMLVMDGRASEGLVVHEVGHIWFYGILANDEQAAAWMDEGFTTFQTRWYMAHRYGPWGDRSKWNFWQRITPQPTLWRSYRDGVLALERAGYAEPVATPADEFRHSYRAAVYRKASLFLEYLHSLAGDEGMTRILNTYYDRHELTHVREDDFRAAAEEVLGRDLRWTFENWLHTRKLCDYRLEDVTARPEGDSVRVSVHIEREGERFQPLDVRFEMPDGSAITRRIDTISRTIRASFVLPAAPRRTTVGPDNSILDVDFADNTLPRRVHVMPDWPGNAWTAEDAYTVRLQPSAWVNDVDGVRAGLRLRGSYYDWARRLRLGVYYGVDSRRVDVDARLDSPMRLLGLRGRWNAWVWKMEGRRDLGLRLDFVVRPELARPPTHRISLGYSAHRLTDPRYLTSPETYDTSRTDVGVDLAYSVDPQADVFSSNLRASLRLGRKWTWGKYRYERLAVEATVRSRREVVPVVDVRLRGFLGLIGGDMPLQRKFGLAGAGPMTRERRFWMRSPGATWSDLNYHVPGDANLRAYRAGDFGVNRVVAFNAELGTRVPLGPLGRLLRPLTGSIAWYAFYDVAHVFDDVNPVASSARVQSLVDGGLFDGAIADAGVGLRLSPPWPFWRVHVRLDAPLWMNHPEVIGETDRTARRYAVSLRAAF